MIDRSLSSLQPPFRAIVDTIIAAMEARGYPVYVAETGRTLERQRELVRLGFSRTLDSRHLTGEAVDLVDGRSHAGHLILWGATDPAWGISRADQRRRSAMATEFFAALGEEVAKVGFTRWGGLWKRPYDPAHIEMDLETL